jgi:hypothetical protein
MMEKRAEKEGRVRKVTLRVRASSPSAPARGVESTAPSGACAVPSCEGRIFFCFWPTPLPQFFNDQMNLTVVLSGGCTRAHLHNNTQSPPPTQSTQTLTSLT